MRTGYSCGRGTAFLYGGVTMKYYAIGTPIGILNEREERYFYLENELLNINRSAFCIWAQYLRGAEERSGNEDDGQIVKALVEAGMLVSTQELLNHMPQRQGCGLGLSVKTEQCTILMGRKVTVSYPAYLFWTFCNGGVSCAEIMEKVNDMKLAFTREYALSTIDELLQHGLITFVA